MNSPATSHSLLHENPYRTYVYAYPHKTAYRPFSQPIDLKPRWEQEACDALSLYLHIPFCTMRCGFCNLFTTPNPSDSLVPLYLEGLRQQAEVVRATLPHATFSRFAIGGGTPTYLDEEQLRSLFGLVRDLFDVNLKRLPSSVELSPETLTLGKVALLKEEHVSRVSIGVQSFLPTETAQTGRPQKEAIVDQALRWLGEARFPTFNIDLIYGLPDQTSETWNYSLRKALSYLPSELYLYPLYVRPLTGLGRSRKAWDDQRLTLYREGRDFLFAHGFRQVSMRHFQRLDQPAGDGPAYCCQEDGMIGLGCGARSYLSDLHYSHDYAVGSKGIKEIIAHYLSRDAEEFARADHGFELDGDEQRRRYLLQSILNVHGLDAARYESRFGTSPTADFPELHLYEELGLLRQEEGCWRPTTLGLERSDALGPQFFSESVQRTMEGYVPK
jgi:oxygen-independent coproporphyrinogen-3 oxidase